MYKIEIISVGKVKEKWLKEALGEYEKRLQKELQITWTLTKNENSLLELLEKTNNFLLLDVQGQEYSSQEFSSLLFEELETGGSRLSLAIGGPKGVPLTIKRKAKKSLSLSKMTFTHQMARLLVAEQIYRAFEIKNNSNYHK